MSKKKYKIFFISDHQLSTAGVGIQARFLIEGLLRTGKYSFICFGAAIKHADYRNAMLSPDFIIKPVDGFGTKEMVKNVLVTERPDAVFILTDPRQFFWLWEMEDEIHQVCPIVYWHVWDNDPYPAFNKPWYDSNDFIGCISWKTYEMLKPYYPDVEYIPHAFPKNIYFPMDEKQVSELRKMHFGHRHDWFIALWVNRNATRKMSGELLRNWKIFLDKLEEQYGHRNALLLLHTDPLDIEGTNLFEVQALYELQDNVVFSVEKLEFEQMNMIHNITDCCINISKNEGFGLSTLISLQCGKPIIALKTGGLERQVVDYRDGFQLGVALEPVTRKLIGSQVVPYIFEDFASEYDVANALLKIYSLSEQEKQEIKRRALEYVDHEFNYENMIKKWDENLERTIVNYSGKSKVRFSIIGRNDNGNKIYNSMRKEVFDNMVEL